MVVLVYIYVKQSIFLNLGIIIIFTCKGFRMYYYTKHQTIIKHLEVTVQSLNKTYVNCLIKWLLLML